MSLFELPHTLTLLVTREGDDARTLALVARAPDGALTLPQLDVRAALSPAEVALGWWREVSGEHRVGTVRVLEISLITAPQATILHVMRLDARDAPQEMTHTLLAGPLADVSLTWRWAPVDDLPLAQPWLAAR